MGGCVVCAPVRTTKKTPSVAFVLAQHPGGRGGQTGQVPHPPPPPPCVRSTHAWRGGGCAVVNSILRRAHLVRGTYHRRRPGMVPATPCPLVRRHASLYRCSQTSLNTPPPLVFIGDCDRFFFRVRCIIYVYITCSVCDFVYVCMNRVYTRVLSENNLLPPPSTSNMGWPPLDAMTLQTRWVDPPPGIVTRRPHVAAAFLCTISPRWDMRL